MSAAGCSGLSRALAGGKPASDTLKLVTLGVGAQASPRFAPAGLLVEYAGVRVMIDGGPGAAPSGKLAAWLVTDTRSELIPRIRELARAKGVEPYAGPLRAGRLVFESHPVVHTSHPAIGYLIRTCGARVVWAPEFFEFPTWAHDVDLMFAEAAGWNRPIRFRGGVGGHLDALRWRRRRSDRVCGGWSSPTSAGPRSGRSTRVKCRPSGR